MERETTELYPCPYSEVVSCCLQDPCKGCETWAKYLVGEETPRTLKQPERKTAEGIKYFINSVYDKIREDLSSAYLINYRDEDGNGYPLLDHLSNTNIITSGREEIDNIIEQIEIDELLTKYAHTYAVQGIDWPSEEESNKILDKKAFRVPYDGSDNFYDESFIKGWKACYEWLLNRVKK